MTDDKPPEKPTVEFDRPPAWAISMMERQGEGFATLRADMDARFDKTDANIELVANDLQNTKEELRVSKEATDLRFAQLESRTATNSLRAKQPSEVDLQLQAQAAKFAIDIAETKVDVGLVKADLAENTRLTREVVSSIGKALKNPIIGKLAVAAIAALISWLVKGHL